MELGGERRESKKFPATYIAASHNFLADMLKQLSHEDNRYPLASIAAQSTFRKSGINITASQELALASRNASVSAFFFLSSARIMRRTYISPNIWARTSAHLVSHTDEPFLAPANRYYAKHKAANSRTWIFPKRDELFVFICSFSRLIKLRINLRLTNEI